MHATTLVKAPTADDSEANFWAFLEKRFDNPGDRLRYVRRLKGFSIKILGEKVGASPTAIIFWENGHPDTTAIGVSQAYLECVCCALGVPFSFSGLISQLGIPLVANWREIFQGCYNPGTRLARAREWRSLSQKELAMHVGVSIRTASCWEVGYPASGKKGVPCKYIDAVCKVLDIPPELAHKIAQPA